MTALREIHQKNVEFLETIEKLGGLYKWWLIWGKDAFHAADRFIDHCQNTGISHGCTVPYTDDLNQYLETLQFIIDARGEKLSQFSLYFDKPAGCVAFCFSEAEEAVMFRLRWE